jgi:hypothetical protein
VTSAVTVEICANFIRRSYSSTFVVDLVLFSRRRRRGEEKRRRRRRS